MTLIRVLSGCALLVAAASSAMAQGPAKETKQRDIGAWDVIRRDEGGRFNRCIAEMRSGSGVLRVAHNAAGKWTVSFPGLGGKAKHTGRARLNKLDEPAVEFQDDGSRAWAPLSPRWVDEFRRGGRLEIAVAGKNYAWDMKDTGAVFGAVQDCVLRARPVKAGPAVVASDPVQTLKAFYGARDKSLGKEPFTRRLAALQAAAVKRSRQINEPVSGLDFSFEIDGQDSEPGTLASVRYEVLSKDAQRASIKVTFRNGGPRELHYDMVSEGSRWLIDDVRRVGKDAWMLSDLYRKGAAGK